MKKGKPVKILVCYRFKKRDPLSLLGVHCAEALRNLGHDVHTFDTSDIGPLEKYFFKPVNLTLSNLRITRSDPVGRNSKYLFHARRNRMFRFKVNKFKPQLIFIIGYPPLAQEVLLEAKKNSILVGWDTGNPMDLEDVMETVFYYDFIFSISRYSVNELRKRNLGNTFYLPHGVDPHLYRKLNLHPKEARPYQCQIAFVGIWYEIRQKILEDLVDFDLGIWGPRWKNKKRENKLLYPFVKGTGLFEGEVVKLYNTAKINLNINAWYGAMQSGMNMRVFEVPACNGFFITDYDEELSEFFRLGEEIETFRDIEELKDKIKFYLCQENVREKVSLKGFEKVRSHHTYKHRMQDILRIVTSG